MNHFLGFLLSAAIVTAVVYVGIHQSSGLFKVGPDAARSFQHVNAVFQGV